MKTAKNHLQQIIPMGICIVFVFIAGIRASEAAYFDFDTLNLYDPLGNEGDSSEIETYMESIYGSDISITAAIK